MKKIVPCLWFDRQAEEAAKFYISTFKKRSRIKDVVRYGKEGFEIHGMPEGTVMTVDFELDGQPFTALNGGPLFRFNEAVSLQVFCKTQKEMDYFWDRLSEGGDPKARQCGWLKDRYGLSWQVVPTVMTRMMRTKDAKKLDRVMKVLLPMKKLDLKVLKRAYEGKT